MAAVSVRVVCWSYCEADSLVMVPIACDVSLCHGAQAASRPGLDPVGAGFHHLAPQQAGLQAQQYAQQYPQQFVQQQPQQLAQQQQVQAELLSRQQARQQAQQQAQHVAQQDADLLAQQKAWHIAQLARQQEHQAGLLAQQQAQQQQQGQGKKRRLDDSGPKQEAIILATKTAGTHQLKCTHGDCCKLCPNTNALNAHMNATQGGSKKNAHPWGAHVDADNWLFVASSPIKVAVVVKLTSIGKPLNIVKVSEGLGKRALYDAIMCSVMALCKPDIDEAKAVRKYFTSEKLAMSEALADADWMATDSKFSPLRYIDVVGMLLK